jgi:TolB protein
MITRLNSKPIITFAASAFLCIFAVSGSHGQPTLEITGETKLGIPPTPITITGFSGEVASVLKFDLAVMGFISVPAGSANYELTGNNAGNVTGQLNLTGNVSPSPDGGPVHATGSKSVLFSRSYQGGSLRAEAHRLADDVVLKITSVNGIAEINGNISKIAFKVDTTAGGEIYISDFDGHDAREATQDHTIVAAPCWVPGHFALYYASYKRGPLNIFHQDLHTGARRVFADFPGMVGSPAASPDGRKVAMVLAKGGSVNIYVDDADDTDGHNLKQLTFTAEDNSSPCWSPDGRWICFASKVNERRALSKVPAEGGHMERIITGGVSNPSEPDWSPDGHWIAFTSQYAGGFNLCVVPAEGGTAVPLVSGEDPSWAPNSRTLVFVRRGSGGNRTLSLLDVPTKQVKDVPRVSGGSNSQPSWAK